jgi:inward rectifier potassium channel
MKEMTRKYNDFGLGNKSNSRGYRAINKDGSFNIEKVNVPYFDKLSFFHELVTMSWTRFLFYVVIGYFLINIIFAGLYIIIGIEHLTITPPDNFIAVFSEAFFFSAQTITTLGYGRVAPVGIAANIVAAVESMLGLLSFALATGLLYGRFSKPISKIKYSHHAVIAPYQDMNAFMFRIVNPQKNQLYDVQATVRVSFKRPHSELRDFYSLELERSMVSFFPSVWTIVHPIDESSPLHGLKDVDFKSNEVEFIVMINAFDESASQPVYSRSSYVADEVKWGQKFIYLGEVTDNVLKVDVSGLDLTTPAVLN